MTEEQAHTLANQLRSNIPMPQRYAFEITVGMNLPDKEYLNIFQAEQLDTELVAWLLEIATTTGYDVLADAYGISDDNRPFVKVIFYKKEKAASQNG